MMSKDLSNIEILKIDNADYHCIIIETSKREAVYLLQNIDSNEYWIIIKHKNHI